MSTTKTIEWSPDVSLPACELFDVDDYYDDELLVGGINECISEYIAARFSDDEIRKMVDSDRVLDVTGYERNILDPGDCRFLDDLIERLDEEYRLDGSGISPDKMAELRELENSFVTAVVERYKVWSCSPIFCMSVPIGEWLRVNPALKEDLGL